MDGRARTLLRRIADSEVECVWDDDAGEDLYDLITENPAAVGDEILSAADACDGLRRPLRRGDVPVCEHGVRRLCWLASGGGPDHATTARGYGVARQVAVPRRPGRAGERPVPGGGVVQVPGGRRRLGLGPGHRSGLHRSAWAEGICSGSEGCGVGMDQIATLLSLATDSRVSERLADIMRDRLGQTAWARTVSGSAGVPRRTRALARNPVEPLRRRVLCRSVPRE